MIDYARMGYGKEILNSEVLNAFFTLVFIGKINLQVSQVTKTSGKFCLKQENSTHGGEGSISK